jgi:Ni/Co efflux regulator RcnB
MKRFLITAAALTLLGAPAAFAQQNPQDKHDHGQNQSGGHPSNSGGQGQGQGNHQSGGPGGASGGNHGGPAPGSGNHSSTGVQFQGHTSTSGGPQGQPPNGGQGSSSQFRAGAFQGRGGNGPPNAGPGRGPAPSFHQNIPAPHHYRAPEFRWPQGFGYRRFSFGDFLPGVFLSQNYWLYDYADYDLPYPPPGMAWVRYGPDALLVDRHTGEVDEVIYGVFY